MRQPRFFVAIHAFTAVVFLVSCCLAGSLPTAGAQESAPALHPESSWNEQSIDLAKLFDSVVETVEKTFFDVAMLKQVDWQTRAKAVRPSVLSAPSADDAVRQINALLSELKTSHTALFTPDEYYYYELLDIAGGGIGVADLMSRQFWGIGPYYSGIGAFTREVDGHHFVDGILEGSPAERAGLKYGDEILSVDGMPYNPIAVFRGKIGATAELAIRRSSEAAPQNLEVSIIPIKPTTAFAAATEASARVIERNGRHLGYVHIWASSESDSFKRALTRLERANLQIILNQRAKGASADLAKDVPRPLDFIIVDMRGRVGGNVAVAGQFLDLLDTKQKPYWGNWRTIGRTPSTVPTQRLQNPLFRGRSVLLIDHHTRSAAEIMAYGFKRSEFGTVVGMPTAGAVSAGAVSVMPGDLLLYVAVTGFEIEDGQRLEGVGVTPDLLVERPLPYAAGADPMLEAAMDLLSRATLP
jgi:carboxyl-terminal processing protease